MDTTTYTKIDGRATSSAIKEEIAAEVAQLTAGGKRPPSLVAVIVGDDGASRTYVNAKAKACEKVGFTGSVIEKPGSTTEAEVLQIVADLNNDPGVDGFIVQLPLPDHIDEEKVTLAIDPAKDVDGFHPENIGRMVLGLPTYLPATPYGIVQLLDRYGIETSGKHCVVMGRSNIVGTPMSLLMSRNTNPGNCTVTLVHSRTQNLKEVTASADILIVAIGKPEFVTADMVKPGATVIDVGIHRIADDTRPKGFKLLGDVAFAEVAAKAAAITPVPGGVGPMTIASLLSNTLLAYKRKG